MDIYGHELSFMISFMTHNVVGIQLFGLKAIIFCGLEQEVNNLYLN